MKKHEQEDKSQDNGEAALPKKGEEIKPRDYLRVVKAHLRGGKQREAFRLLQQATLHYPKDPMLLSYYGCLQAVVDKKYRNGVETCKKAISLLKGEKIESFERDLIYPAFYLNLGRAFVAAGKMKDAIDAFNKGLQYDKSNRDILKELRGLGIRKKPPVPFLERSNPINKYIGIILHKGKNNPG